MVSERAISEQNASVPYVIDIQSVAVPCGSAHAQLATTRPTIVQCRLHALCHLERTRWLLKVCCGVVCRAECTRLAAVQAGGGPAEEAVLPPQHRSLHWGLLPDPPPPHAQPSH